MKEKENNKITEIHFEIENENKTSVLVKRGEKTIGRVWSQGSDGFLPYPHDKNKTYCKNSIQICGFDKISEIWSCGPFTGKKDCVVSFLPIETDDWHKEQLKKYEKYAKNFFNAEIKEIKTGATSFNVSELHCRKDISKLKSFADWIIHGDISDD